MIEINPSKVNNLPVEDQQNLQKLLKVHDAHYGKNKEKEKYYEGKITLADVNLGLALPDGVSRLEIGCAWGAKTVDVLAGLSMFDGFVGVNGDDVLDLERLVADNNLVAEYMKATRDS